MSIESGIDRRWHPKNGVPFTITVLTVLAIVVAVVCVAIARAYE